MITDEQVLFYKIQDYFQNREDGRGWCHATCPFCGKEGKHFAFRVEGYKCLVCGAHGGLYKLALQIGVHNRWTHETPWAPRPAPVAQPEPEVPWLADAAGRIARSLAHPGRLTAWSSYKPLTRETLDRWQFGLGTLPFQARDGQWYESRSEWLTVPLYDANGVLCGLRGRNLGTVGPKWISATGTHYTLWGARPYPLHAAVWICENYVDAAWLMQAHPDISAVALGGASNWRAEWAAPLQGCDLIVVALDNDLAGQANAFTYRRLLAERRQAHPGLPDLVPNGPKLANDLLAQGLTVRLYPWPETAPAKADVGWLLQQEARR